MPIKTTITADADPTALKASLALLDKYQAALKALYGRDVLKAPHIAAVSTAARDIAAFMKSHEAAAESASATQDRFAKSAQLAGKHFAGLAGSVEKSVANVTRYALTPLEAIIGEGAIGGLALGAGLVTGGIALAAYAGYKAWQGLERGAGDVTAARRQAMGLGVGYGALSSYDLNFNRFGLGAETLSNIATGVYDVTSPQYLPLLTSGAATGDTASAAIGLIKNLPEMLKNVPDQMVGTVARSRGWTNILGLDEIIRLKNASPEEVQRQIQNYEADQKTLDISAVSQEKWASFDAAINRAGRKIETVLAGELAPLADPLTHLSESAVHLIDALVNSGTITSGLRVVETGLEGFGDALSSHNFHEDAKRFKAGIDALYPYLATMAKIARVFGRFGALGYKLWEDPNYNPSAAEVAAALLGQNEPDREVPPPHVSVGRGDYSIRGYAGHGADRPKYGGIIDSATGKLLPRPQFKYSPKSGEGGGSGWNASAGDIPPDVLAKVQAANPNLTPRQCVELVQATMGVGNVHDWRRGPSETDSPEGAALATFGVHGDSDLYAYGGSGTPGIGRDHALKLVKKYPDGSFDAVSQDIGHAPHLIHMPYTGRGGEGDASSYFAIFNKSGPAGGNIELFGRKVPINDVKNSVLKEEHLQGGGFPSLGGVPPNAPGTPSGMRATTGWYDRLPGAARDVVGPAMPAAKGIDPHLSGGPITVYDYTGGATTVTMNNVHTAQ